MISGIKRKISWLFRGMVITGNKAFLYTTGHYCMEHSCFMGTLQSKKRKLYWLKLIMRVALVRVRPATQRSTCIWRLASRDEAGLASRAAVTLGCVSRSQWRTGQRRGSNCPPGVCAARPRRGPARVGACLPRRRRLHCTRK